MHTVSGGCHCGNIRVELGLSRPPEQYQPRACDCSFCIKHGASYVSDPRGTLRIRIGDPAAAARYRQGSGQAELLLCRSCGVLVGPLFRDGGQLYAAVNSKAIDAGVSFGAPQTVSPQSLSGEEKVQRWQSVWFADVTIVTTQS